MDYLPGTLGENLDVNFSEEDLRETNTDNVIVILQSPESVYILKESNVFDSIFADPDASITKGMFYISNNKSLTIVNVTNGQAFIKDYYTKTTAGSTGQTLDSDTVVDSVVNFT